MECAFLGLLFIALVVAPLIRMLLSTGPNGLRRLQRIDLASFFVLTAGIGLAFGATRAVARNEGAAAFAFILVITLPMGLAAAWFGRFLVEDLAFLFGKRRRASREADLSRLDVSNENGPLSSSDLPSETD